MATNNNGEYQPSLKRRYFDSSRGPVPPRPLGMNPHHYDGTGPGPGHGPMGFGGGPPNKRPPIMPGVGGAGGPSPWNKGPIPSGSNQLRPVLPPPQFQQAEIPPGGAPGPEALTNLIVNYLPQTLADEELHEMFAPYGEINTLRIVRDKNTGYSFGYGFVRYTNPSSAAMAISVLNGLQVMNKVIKVSFARPPSTEIKDTNLYITNLPRTTTDMDLVRMFAPFGDIVQKHILFDKYTQLPRGVAFVRYDRREQANAAIEQMNGFIPPGAEEALNVRLAENHGKQKASYASGFQAGYQKRF